MANVLQQIGTIPSVRRLADEIGAERGVDVTGLRSSAAALVAAWLAGNACHRMLVVCAGGEEAEEFAEDMNLFQEELACYFPALEVLPGDAEEPSEAILRARLTVLRHLALGKTPERAEGMAPLDYLEPGPETRVVVTSVRALLQPTCTVGELRDGSRTLELGTKADPRELVEWLASNGYFPLPQVQQPGQYCLRGGILDVYSHGAPEPVRIEFFGDEVDSIRTFDPLTQLSTGKIGSCQLTMAEHGADGESRVHGNLLSFLDAATAVVLVAPERLWSRAETIYERTEQRHLLARPDDVRADLDACQRIALHEQEPDDGHPIHVESVTRDSFGGELDATLAELDRIARDFPLTWVYCTSPAEADRFRALLRDRDFGRVEALRMGVGRLNHAAMFPEAGLALVPHHRLFGRYRQRRLLRSVPEGRPLDSITELSTGDIVVHVRYGIGRFLGVSTLEVEGTMREHLRLEFADEVHVHVPCDRIEMVHRYIGSGGKEPELSKIGTSGWSRAKKRAQDSIEDLAAEMLELQAVRETQHGLVSPVETEWQTQFESEFPYEETEDQLRAIEDVKNDMNADRPMDRLICGDVGYGKTEVAMRAAFACVMGGRQVAMLVPTTVLAQQHFRTFRERMADYPVRVEMLSRFLTDAEARHVIEGLASGEVDICIGTHRLLGRSVKFKELGLVIIDEEQRFGVVHKEKLKHLRATVDVLTLTATPIPRTLHMALMGLREISALQTPPSTRQAIETRVGKYDPNVLRHAVVRELNREGQVFVIHNRVRTIRAFAVEVQRIVPEARVAVGHGQMPERELADVMNRFQEGEVDVLVSTTIVESGLDIPNANTIIMDRADLLGLAEMHQLRGRVGRYIHKAYAYLFVPRKRPVTPEAEARLDTIRQYSQLGAGFDIAMRDLEIRGAGNILGPKQSGHIAAIGYNLYCRLLTATVRSMRGEPPAEQPEVTLHLGLDAHLPDDYVPLPKHKMQMYRQINQAGTLEDLAEATQALRDRFGAPPEPVLNLLTEAELRILAGRAGVDMVRVQDGRLHFGIRDRALWDTRFPKGSGPRLVADDLAVLDRGFPREDPNKLAFFLQRLFERGAA